MRNLRIHFQQSLEIPLSRSVWSCRQSIGLNLLLVPSSVIMILRSPRWKECIVLISLLLSKMYWVPIAVKEAVRSKRIHWMLIAWKFILIRYLLLNSSILILYLLMNFSIFILIQSIMRYWVSFLFVMRSPLTYGLLLLLLLIISHFLIWIHLKAISFFYYYK